MVILSTPQIKVTVQCTPPELMFTFRQGPRGVTGAVGAENITFVPCPAALRLLKWLDRLLRSGTRQGREASTYYQVTYEDPERDLAVWEWITYRVKKGRRGRPYYWLTYRTQLDDDTDYFNTGGNSVPLWKSVCTVAVTKTQAMEMARKLKRFIEKCCDE